MSIVQELSTYQAQLTAPGAPFELTEVEVKGIKLKAYLNAPSTLAELVSLGRQYGDQEFVVYEDDRWTFNRLYAAADALAAQLRDVLNVRSGDKVAIIMRNRPEWIVAFVAVASLGAVPAPVNSYGMQTELLQALNKLKSRVILCDVERFNRIGADGLAGLGSVAVVLNPDPASLSDSVLCWRDLVAGAADAGPAKPDTDLGVDDVALVLFTSGASAQAKAAVSTHRAVCQALWNINYIGALMAMTSPKIISAMMQRGYPPTILSVVPMFHVSGLHAQLLSSLIGGRRLVFMQRWGIAEAIDLIREEKITQVNGAPATMLQLLGESAFHDQANTGSVGGLGFGGSGLPKPLLERLEAGGKEYFAGIGFGLTETNGAGSASSGVVFDYKQFSSGVISPIVEVRTAQSDGSFLPSGKTGELCLRGVTVMREYLGDAAATANAIDNDGWFRSGDVGYVDDEGFLYVVDRIKDVINRSGEKVASVEVESCLLGHPHILEAAVFAAPDANTGERVVAVVVADASVQLSEDDVIAYATQHLAAYKVPAQVHVRHEELPRNPAGKLLKSAIKSAYTDDAARAES